MLHNAGSYYPDMEIVCDDGSIPCHSNILAVASPYFKVKIKYGHFFFIRLQNSIFDIFLKQKKNAGIASSISFINGT